MLGTEDGAHEEDATQVQRRMLTLQRANVSEHGGDIRTGDTTEESRWLGQMPGQEKQE